ncbi:hypothetical protein RRG08_052442 [Elysia crispata]|uniref:Uncharacterized protein n=1 Tax=Elysia crispata TaxID=231223 RepID=A0AAE1B181_9GAST|nr:hypothetical protein RRG08_052442 [Elysia crispata]
MTRSSGNSIQCDVTTADTARQPQRAEGEITLGSLSLVQTPIKWRWQTPRANHSEQKGNNCGIIVFSSNSNKMEMGHYKTGYLTTLKKTTVLIKRFVLAGLHASSKQPVSMRRALQAALHVMILVKV